MKKSIYFCFALLIMACSIPQQKPLPVEEVTATSGEKILLGAINRANLQTSSITPWFEQEFERHSIDDQWAENLKPHLKGLFVKVFMGTWCEDSQREVPHFFKLLQALDFDPDKVEMYAMSEEKTTPQNFEKDWEIFNIPTLVFLRDGKEINRFVEFPVNTLESDIEKIILGADYTHSYE